MINQERLELEIIAFTKKLCVISSDKALLIFIKKKNSDSLSANFDKLPVF